MSPAPNLVCQLCPTDRFEPYRVEGRDTGLLVCTGCRLVYAPREPERPRLQGTQRPVPPDPTSGWRGPR